MLPCGSPPSVRRGIGHDARDVVAQRDLGPGENSLRGAPPDRFRLLAKPGFPHPDTDTDTEEEDQASGEGARRQ